MDTFQNIYDSLTDNQKDDFLWNLLQKRADIRNQLIEYFKSGEEKEADGEEEAEFRKPEDVIEIIEDTCKDVVSVLEEIDFEDVDWEDYVPPHSGYVPEWEAFDSIIIQKVDDAFEYEMPDVVSPIENGDIIQGVAMVLGMYEGCIKAQTDGNDVFGDAEEEFINRWEQGFLEDAVGSLDITNKNNQQLKVLFQAILERYKENEKDILRFEELLIALIENNQIAEYVKNLIKEKNIPSANLPNLIVEINEMLGDNNALLAHAEENCINDFEVAKKVLDIYLKEGKKEDYLRIANKVFPVFPVQLSEYIENEISANDDKELLIKILSELIAKYHDLERYKKLRKILPQSELNSYIEGWKNDTIFHIKILEIEERYEDILNIVERLEFDWSFVEAIEPILNIFPLRSYEILEQRVENSVANERGRSNYEKVCSWLKAMRRIEKYSAQTQQFIMKIYKHNKPTLPALRDEMRKAKLVI